MRSRRESRLHSFVRIVLPTLGLAFVGAGCSSSSGAGTVKMPTVAAKATRPEGAAPPVKKPGKKPPVKGAAPGKPIGTDARSGKS